MAEDLGKKLLKEVEECGMDDLLHTLRLLRGASSTYFGLPHLDRLLATAAHCRQSRTHVQTETQGVQPIIELTSLHAGGGATHLLYHLTALAILPPHSGTVVVVDADGTFSVSRLAELLRGHLSSVITYDQPDVEVTTFENAALMALSHVHVFRPHSLSSLTATIRGLPEYLFMGEDHSSLDRSVGFVAIDSLSAFTWQEKAEAEDDAVLHSSGSKAASSKVGYSELAVAVRQASTALHCPIMVTSWYLGSLPSLLNAHGHGSHSFRPSLPAPWATLSTLRLAVQRVAIRKFPAAISVEAAFQEAEDRLKAVEEGRFECFLNEWGVNEQTLQTLQRAGTGFGFSIREDGVLVDQ